MQDEVIRLVDEVREQNTLFESGKIDQAFWLGQQGRLRRLIALGLTQRQIAREVDRNPGWVSKVLTWDTVASTQHSPFEGEKDEYHAVAAVERRAGRVLLENSEQGALDSLVGGLAEDRRSMLRLALQRNGTRLAGKPTKASLGLSGPTIASDRKAVENVIDLVARVQENPPEFYEDPRRRETLDLLIGLEGAIQSIIRLLREVGDDE